MKNTMEKRNTFRVAIRKFDPFASAIQKQWASFCEAFGVNLTLEAIELDLHLLYETLFENNGLKNGEWDVGFVNSDWFAEAHQRDALLDLASHIETEPPEDYPGGWTDSLLRLQTFAPRVMGLAFHDGPQCLICRKDLFDDPGEQSAYQQQFGKPLAVPETWDDFAQIARFFTRPGQNLYGTVFAAYPDGHNTVYDFCIQLWTRGGKLFDTSDHMTLDTPQAIDALSFYRGLLNDPTAIHPNARDFDSVKSGLAFANGEIAMMTNWFGFAAMSESISDSKVTGKISVSDIPHAPDCSSASLNVYWILAIGSGSPHSDIAYAFLRHCASADQDKLLTLEGGIGCRMSTWTDTEVNTAIPFYHMLEPLHKNALELPRLTHWAQLAEIIDQLVLNTINTHRPIAELLQEAQRAVDALK
jgi:multiple sugar transport system substrate-binding protein